MHSILDNGRPAPCPERFNLARYVLDAGRQLPDKPALIVLGREGVQTVSFDELCRRVFLAAGHLATQGHAPGGRVLIRLGNTDHFPIAFLAAAAADLVPVVVSSLLTEPEIQNVVSHVSPGLVIADRDLPLGPVECDVLAPEDLTRPDVTPLDPIDGDPDRPGYIVFTSGTSAQPRAVLHAHRAVWARRMMWQDWYGLTRDDRVLHAGAFNWTYTLGTGLLDPWAMGATALVPEPGLPPETLARHIGTQDVTIFAAAPSLYRRMLNAVPRVPGSALRHGLSAGEKMSDTICEHWTQATGTPVHEAFGMSECSTFISGSPGAPAPAGTIGRAQDGRRIAVLDDDCKPVPRGVPGRLAIHGADQGLMLGYLEPNGKLDLPLKDGWFLTNDTVSMGEDGTVTYQGRADDMLNAGGIRVSPLEVEAALSLHEAVEDCAVTELRVKKDVCVIAGFCVSNQALDEAALSTHMSSQLARYKCPRVYVRVEALPRNANGKLKRRALREAWEAENGQT